MYASSGLAYITCMHTFIHSYIHTYMQLVCGDEAGCVTVMDMHTLHEIRRFSTVGKLTVCACTCVCVCVS
jgi:hypothetical protein